MRKKSSGIRWRIKLPRKEFRNSEPYHISLEAPGSIPVAPLLDSKPNSLMVPGPYFIIFKLEIRRTWNRGSCPVSIKTLKDFHFGVRPTPRLCKGFQLWGVHSLRRGRGRSQIGMVWILILCVLVLWPSASYLKSVGQYLLCVKNMVVMICKCFMCIYKATSSNWGAVVLNKQ